MIFVRLMTFSGKTFEQTERGFPRAFSREVSISDWKKKKEKEESRKEKGKKRKRSGKENRQTDPQLD